MSGEDAARRVRMQRTRPLSRRTAAVLQVLNQDPVTAASLGGMVAFAWPWLDNPRRAQVLRLILTPTVRAAIHAAGPHS